MILKLIIFAIGGMLAYRWLTPQRSIDQHQEKGTPSESEYTDYEIIDDD